MKEENKDIPKYKEKQSIDILNEGLYHKNKEHIQRKRRKIHDREINLENDFDDDFDQSKLLNSIKVYD